MSVETLGLLVALITAVMTWLTIPLSLPNYIVSGFVLLLITIAFEVEQIQAIVRQHRRDKLLRRLTAYQIDPDCYRCPVPLGGTRYWKPLLNPQVRGLRV